MGEALHPYFGPTHLPGTPFDIPASLREGTAVPERLTTNNFGFVSPHDYPFAKTSDDQVILGLFGGSVGLWFCQIGAPRLVEQLRANPYFKDREIVPLCFAHEGYKQPQQAARPRVFPLDWPGVRPGREHRRLQRCRARGAQQRAGAGHLDAERAAPRPADCAGQPIGADAEKLATLAAIFRDRQTLWTWPGGLR